VESSASFAVLVRDQAELTARHTRLNHLEDR